MYRGAATKRCLSIEGLTFRVNHIEDVRGECWHAGALELRRQGTQGLRDIPRQLDAGAVAIVHIRGKDAMWMMSRLRLAFHRDGQYLMGSYPTVMTRSAVSSSRSAG